MELPCAERHKDLNYNNEDPSRSNEEVGMREPSPPADWTDLNLEEEFPEPPSAAYSGFWPDGDNVHTGEKSFQRLLVDLAMEHRRALAEQRHSLQRGRNCGATIRTKPLVLHPSATLSSWTKHSPSSSPNSRSAWKPKASQKSVRLSPFDFPSEGSSIEPAGRSDGGSFVATLLRVEGKRLWRRELLRQVFDGISSAAILLNCVSMGWAANASVLAAAEGRLGEEQRLMARVSLAFTAWFVLELLLRFCTAGSVRAYFTEHWNLFDLLIVGSDVVQSVLDLISSSGGEVVVHNLTVVRVLRILRVTRAVRVLRILRFFRELRMMIVSVLRSGSSLLWSLVLLGITIYVFALYFVQVLALHLQAAQGSEASGQDIAGLMDMFGSLLRAEYTLYMAVSGGINWGEVARLLLALDGLHVAVFCFYTFFTTFALLNIITGVFVETSISSARSSQEELAQEQLYVTRDLMQEMRKIFAKADQDGSGTISLVEFEVWLESREVRAYLHALGIEIDKAKDLFELLDLDMSGEITVEEFTFGCLRLKGGAKSIDLASLMNHTRRMGEQWRGFFKYSEEQFRRLQEFEARLEDRLRVLFDPLDTDSGSVAHSGSMSSRTGPAEP